MLRSSMKRTWFRIIAGCLLVLFILLGIVAACELAFRLQKGAWYYQVRAGAARALVEPHPYFGAYTVPNMVEERNGVRISHNSLGIRGPEFARPKPAGLTRIVALGGSTTYGTGVSDHETWEYHLNRQLGTNYEVINMGAPGGTSVENLGQSALLFSEVQPDLALYYLGWNDARVQHVKGLKADYSDFHGKWMMAHGLGGRDMKARTAAGYLLNRFIFHKFFPRMDMDKVLKDAQGDAGALTDQIDARALSLYERNLGLIIAICRQQGVRPIFIPQVLNYAELTSDQPYGWLPFVRDRDLKKVIAAYNETLAKVAQREGVGYIGEVLEPEYQAADFSDNGHFTNAGNEKFARAVEAGLRRVLATGTNRVP